MGCDIHSRAERKVDGKWQIIDGLAPFDWRSYGMYSFLANVRNYTDVPPLSDPRGIPDDAPMVEDDHLDLGDHSYSWLSVDELTSFNYDAQVKDRSYTWREFLGKAFFDDLKKLKDAGAERIVFGFDS